MKTIHSGAYKVLLNWLISQRQIAGVTQQQLSLELSKPQSFVSKYENGERRLDIVETFEICKILKADPHKLINILEEELS